jgi:myo-inositol-1(or 4)-monophosphatase
MENPSRYMREVVRPLYAAAERVAPITRRPRLGFGGRRRAAIRPATSCFGCSIPSMVWYGTFLHGLPLCAVSLSLCDASTVVAALIDLPFIGSQYTTLLGQGAYADGKRLRVSETSTLADALISLDQYAFGEDAERKNRLRLRLTERLAHDAQRVRMLGASAIDLAWTAEGRLDACIMLGNKPWTPAPGFSSLVKPGARVLDHDGSDHSQASDSTIAVTPALEADLMAAVQAALAE